MKKILTLCSALVLILVLSVTLAACGGKGKVNAETPTITTQPVGATYAHNADAAALTIAATVSDGGDLHYQWFKNTINGTTGAVACGGNTAMTPSTAETGTLYYYCEVINTNANATGTRTANKISNIVAVEVTGTAGAVQLSAPTLAIELEYIEGKDYAVWTFDENATKYQAYIPGGFFEDNIVDLYGWEHDDTHAWYFLGVLSIGEYTIKVRAVGDGESFLTSAWSNEVVYVKEGEDDEIESLGDFLAAITNAEGNYHILAKWVTLSEFSVIDVNGKISREIATEADFATQTGDIYYFDIDASEEYYSSDGGDTWEIFGYIPGTAFNNYYPAKAFSYVAEGNFTSADNVHTIEGVSIDIDEEDVTLTDMVIEFGDGEYTATVTLYDSHAEEAFTAIFTITFGNAATLELPV